MNGEPSATAGPTKLDGLSQLNEQFDSLVIFDCDGVLVDSEPISNGVLSEAITRAGVPTTCEEATASFSGHRLADIVSSIETRLGKPLPDQCVAFFQLMTRTYSKIHRGL